jgi:hypothetical protein
MASSQQIIFVYNARSGFMHSMTDLFRKTAKPSANPCKLCSLTYSGAFMKKIWKEYVARLGMPAVFMHKDEFASAYPDYDVAFPVVLLAKSNALKVLINNKDFKNLNDLTDLMKLLSKRLTNEK